MTAAWKVEANADWAELLETLYAPAENDRIWGRRVVDLAGRMMGAKDDTILSCISHDPECTRFEPVLVVNIPFHLDFTDTSDKFRVLGRRFFSTLWYPPSPVATSKPTRPPRTRQCRKAGEPLRDRSISCRRRRCSTRSPPR